MPVCSIKASLWRLGSGTYKVGERGIGKWYRIDQWKSKWNVGEHRERSSMKTIVCACQSLWDDLN